MTNEELKKKIKEILRKRMTELLGSCHTDEIPLTEEGAEAILFYADEFADALIAAGIGDVKDLQAQVNVLEITNIALQAGYDDAEKDRLYWVNKYKEAEHRADVAERALRNAAPRLNCRGGLGKGFCKVDKCDYYHCNNDDGCVKAHLDQAEKELAEEKR